MKTWDPGRVVVVYGVAPLSGFAPGTFVKASMMTDTYRRIPGCDGDSTRVRSRDAGARVTLTLLQSSASNAVLNTAVAGDRVLDNGLPPVPLIVKSMHGLSLFFAQQAWVVRPTDQEYAATMTGRVWSFECRDATITEGWV